MSQWSTAFSSQFLDSLSSESQKRDIDSTPVGASSVAATNDSFYYHEHFMKWISETDHKIPRGTPELREKAFLADPLIKGTLFPFKRNTTLKGFKIETDDNKLYSEAISDVKAYLKSIKLMKCFRDDFLNLHFLVGDSYRRADPDINGNIIHLESIEPYSVKVFTDPWNSEIKFYRQRADVEKDMSDYPALEKWDSWFVPYNNKGPNIFDTYVEGRTAGNSKQVYDLFNVYKEQNKFTTFSNIRIAASERIIEMHHATNIKIRERDEFSNYTDSHYAPIDTVLMDIFIKILLKERSPNLVDVVLSPFLHATMGTVEVVRDAQGTPIVVSSLPERPVNSDPLYAEKMQKFNDFMEYFQELSKNLIKGFKDGGVVTTLPDVKLNTVESSRNINHQFFKGMEDILDDNICYNFGIPKALISSKGSELATSRTVAETYNNTQEGDRIEYQDVANDLIERQFGTKIWTVKTTEKDEDGNKKEITKNYSIYDINLNFVLETLNTKDLLQEAQAFKTKAEGIAQIKSLGAGKEDIQALCEEELDVGILDLDNFAAAPTLDTSPDIQAQVKAILPILKACIYPVLVEEGLISAKPTDPSNFKDKKITEKLQDAYKTARETIDQLFEEH